MIYGSGQYRYELVDGWLKYPEGYAILDVGGISIDAQDRVYVMNRSGAHPVNIFDRQGNFLRSWGEGYFKRPHGSFITPDQLIYIADDNRHIVSKFTLDGKLLSVLGNADQPSDTGSVWEGNLNQKLDSIKRAGPPFNRPTAAVPAPSGEIYVSDGYGNTRVHKFSADGKLLLSWGEPGNKPGQFRLPHNIKMDKLGRLWVVDRENRRIQIFNTNGEFITQWTDLIRPTTVSFDEEDTVYISEVDRRVSIFTFDGKLLARWGSGMEEPKETALFVAPHALAVDSHGDIYIGEVAWTHVELDKGPKIVQKFARIR